MFTDLFELSGGWVALLIVAIIAIAAAVIAIVLRARDWREKNQSARPRGPSSAPGAPRPQTPFPRKTAVEAAQPEAPKTEAPRPTITPEQPVQRPSPAPAPPPRRTEGIGSASAPIREQRLPTELDRPAPDRTTVTGVGAAAAAGTAVSAAEIARRMLEDDRRRREAAIRETLQPKPAPSIAQPSAAAPAPMQERAATIAREPAAGAPVAGAPTVSAPVGVDKGDHVAVTVHYGTDRRDVGETPSNPGARYTHERADTTAASGTVSYGVCTVSIPKKHVVGGLEDRTWWQWTTGQERTPDQHVMVVSLTAQQPALFFSTLSQAVARSSKKDAFVFVHGFSVSFADAARRTAQMAYDLRFEGAPIFFSWPTPDIMSAPLTAYTTSEGNAELSKHRLRAFLQDVLEKSGAQTLHVIAHSMGNRLVTEALQMLDSVSTAHLKPRIGEVILTAPDIDTGVFNEIIAPRLTKFAARVTLYASTKDQAIGASAGAHSNPRVGDFQSLLTVPAGIEVIDATSADLSSLGHSYYGDSESVIADLCYLLNLGERAANRGLTLAAATTPGGAPCWSVVQRPLTEVYAAISARRMT